MNQQETELLDLLLRNAKACAQHLQPCSGQVLGWLNCHQTLVTSAGLRESMGVPETDFGNTEEGDTFTGTTKEVTGDCPISVLTLKEASPPKRGRKSRGTPAKDDMGVYVVDAEGKPTGEVITEELLDEVGLGKSWVKERSLMSPEAAPAEAAPAEAAPAEAAPAEEAVETASDDAQQTREEPKPEPTTQNLSEIYNQLKKKYAGDPETWKTISDKLVAARDSVGARTLSLVSKEDLPNVFAQFAKIAAESPAV